jgi:1-acyl-sn-glycerol-3-phosphate acyltransferase
MRRKINPILQALLVVYHSLVFLPLGILITLICSAIIIIMLPIAGNAKWGSYPAMFWARALCAISLVRIKVEGQEHLDPKASYIFVANHQSLYDIPLVYGWLKNNFKWIIKKEFRKMPVMGYLCYRMGHIFIDRSNPMRAKQSLDQAKQNLKKGNTSIFLFPEGTRTRNGQVGRFKRGAFTIARDLHLPIVPVSIIGAYEALPKGLNCIIPGKIKIIFHQPIDTTHLTDENLNEMVDNVREIVTKDIKTKRK